MGAPIGVRISQLHFAFCCFKYLDLATKKVDKYYVGNKTCRVLLLGCLTVLVLIQPELGCDSFGVTRRVRGGHGGKEELRFLLHVFLVDHKVNFEVSQVACLPFDPSQHPAA